MVPVAQCDDRNCVGSVIWLANLATYHAASVTLIPFCRGTVPGGVLTFESERTGAAPISSAPRSFGKIALAISVLFWAFLPHSYAWSTSVLVDKFDAGKFEGPSEFLAGDGDCFAGDRQGCRQIIGARVTPTRADTRSSTLDLLVVDFLFQLPNFEMGLFSVTHRNAELAVQFG